MQELFPTSTIFITYIAIASSNYSYRLELERANGPCKAAKFLQSDTLTHCDIAAVSQKRSCAWSKLFLVFWAGFFGFYCWCFLFVLFFLNLFYSLLFLDYCFFCFFFWLFLILNSLLLFLFVPVFFFKFLCCCFFFGFFLYF